MTSPFLTIVDGVANLPPTVTCPVSIARLWNLSVTVSVICRMPTYVVLHWPVSKLARENLEQLPIPPSFLAVGVIRIVIRFESSQASFEVVLRRRIARRYSNIRRFLDGIRRGHLHCGINRYEGEIEAAAAGQICCDSR